MMSLERWNQNVKKRREQKVQFLKQGKEREKMALPPPIKPHELDFYHMSPDVEPWNQPYVGAKHPIKRKSNWFKTQLLISALLFVVTLLIFQAHTPILKPAERFMTQAFTREFNFAGMSAQYEKYIGEAPAILPAFQKDKEDKEQVITWSAPVKGTVGLPFDEKRKGLVLYTTDGAPVHAAAEGLVVFVGNKEGLGNLVKVQHMSGVVTWYGLLDDIQVKQKDWVKRGDVIGSAVRSDQKSMVYLAVEHQDRFINPVDVMSFE
ncbi:M23 family metallopeptidase [Polycladospora coralii]|uniref:M23 family metallopeptidase n=1 Tax=Polycladospora coralii TaxID=2771432 RepID=UPI0020BDB79F|nr:M23 family metallopeptidase [Polycladospora coralii]